MFQTSLRTWQATYKARQGQADADLPPESRNQRQSRLKRRPRRLASQRTQA